MKKSLAVFTIIIMLFSAVACNVHAQFARQGVVEFGGSIAYSNTTAVSDGKTASESTSLFNFMPYVNYFITDGFSVALSPTVNVLKFAGSSDSNTNLDLFVIPGYTFTTGSIIYPYVEALLGYTSVESGSNPVNSGFSYGGKAGIKLLVGKSGLFSIGVTYADLDISPKGATNRYGYNELALSMGFSVFIGK
jgi:hypothetical protein